MFLLCILNQSPLTTFKVSCRYLVKLIAYEGLRFLDSEVLCAHLLDSRLRGNDRKAGRSACPANGRMIIRPYGLSLGPSGMSPSTHPSPVQTRRVASIDPPSIRRRL